MVLLADGLPAQLKVTAKLLVWKMGKGAHLGRCPENIHNALHQTLWQVHLIAVQGEQQALCPLKVAGRQVKQLRQNNTSVPHVKRLVILRRLHQRLGSAVAAA